MPVPIPLNECVMLDTRHLLWATSHTPYGAARPCAGFLICDAWHPLENDDPSSGLILFEADVEVARLVPLERLGLPGERVRRLREDQTRHQHRAAREPAYAHRWALRFREAGEALRMA